MAHGAEDAGRERGVRVGLVVHRRRRAGEVEDDFGVDVERLANIADLEVKPRIAPGCREVAEVARHEVVEADDFVPFGEKSLDEVRADEPRRAGDQNRFSNRAEPHVALLSFSGRFARR